ncbi:MAG TPA: MlaD family protein [Candidatus Udaeobacter sp.]|jgi:phospholipid/cholesterol/gamma-HCH transport system substrate-binding protein|nr:MlaD family protein [Candidatus Udaeobacter sp.]
MSRHERGLEFKVGIFVFVGLAMLGALVVQFGRLGEGFKTYYNLTVRFNDASGLLKGTDVLLAGARIGKVAGAPRLVHEGTGIAVPLKIYDYIKIPEGTKFTVGSSGLLGDRFVNVTIPSGQPKAYLPPNASISGARETGIDDITREGTALITDARGTVQKLNQETLSAENMRNLKVSMEHLNEATTALAQSSKKLDGVIEQAGSTMTSAKEAADKLQSAIEDLRKVLRTATQGKGLVATLLNNQQLANDLHALISNLRAHGVLFYRDSATTQTKPQGQTKPVRQTRGR